MNRVTLIGRMASDVELRTTQTGRKVARFCLATRRPSAKEGQRDADFINCVAWEKAGEIIAKYVVKGDRFAVHGRLEYSDYEKDGVKRRDYHVTIEDFEFLESKKDPLAGGEEYEPTDEELSVFA